MQRTKITLPNGDSGYLEIKENILILFSEKGIITKELEKFTEFQITDIKSTQIKQNKKDFKSMYEFNVNFRKEKEQSISLFSDELNSLEQIKREIDEKIEKQNLELELEDKKNQIKKDHITQISLIMKFLDKIFNIIIELDKSVNWHQLNTHLKEMSQIKVEMNDNLISFPSFNTDPLSNSIKIRQVDKIKEECYDLIQLIYEMSKNPPYEIEEIKRFELSLYRLFLESYLIILNIKVGIYLEMDIPYADYDALKNNFSKIFKIVESSECQEIQKTIETLYSKKKSYSDLENLREKMFRCLKSEY
jgi:hypothetical protein